MKIKVSNLLILIGIIFFSYYYVNSNKLKNSREKFTNPVTSHNYENFNAEPQYTILEDSDEELTTLI